VLNRNSGAALPTLRLLNIRGTHVDIYCYFDGKDKQPYERLSFCERRTLDEHSYFAKIVPLEEVRRETKRRGIKSSFQG
jgi:hypothetical protein